jgi:hypothetical protein
MAVPSSIFALPFGRMNTARRTTATWSSIS